jgi:hypothetical protein
MNTARQQPRFQSLLSATVRFAAVAAVATGLAVATMGAAQASHEALQAAGERFSQRTTHVTLPRVEIIVRRAPATPTTL